MKKFKNAREFNLLGKIGEFRLEKVKRIGNSLLGKILIASIVCILVPLIVALVFTLNTSSDTLGKEAHDTMASLTSEKQKQMDAMLDDLFLVANYCKDDPTVVEFAKEMNKTGKPDAKKAKIIADRLEKLMKDYKGKVENVLYGLGKYQIDGYGGEPIKKSFISTGHSASGGSSAGAEVSEGMEATKGADASNPSAATFGMGKEAVGMIVSGEFTVTGRPALGINAGIYDETDKILGMFVLGADLDTVAKEVTANTKKDVKSIIISSQGTVICSQDMAQISKLNFSKEKGDMQTFFKELKAKNKGTGYFTLKGVRNIASYEKCKSQDMYVITYMPVSKYLSKTNSLRTGLFLVIIISFIIAGSIIVILARRIIKPISLATDYVKEFASGDFSSDISEKYMKGRDETGVLLTNLNIMKDSMKGIIQTVVSESQKLNDSSTVVNKNISELDSEVSYVSSTTVDISSGMTETAAATQEMYASSTELENAVNSIAEKAEQGAMASEEISSRAQGLKQSALTSQKSANGIRESIEIGLKTAIEQSKAVEKINVLTDAILQITSQTNLLALNAAIEAARAGEYGKGFAVVADEIRKLAENSKNAVTEIQNVTKQVVASVDNLTQNSQKVLDFINSTVIQDYKLMVETGEQYYKDAEFVEDLVTDFSATSEELSASIQNLVKIVNEISVANSESAKGTENIAKKAVSVSQKTSEVAKVAMGTKESSEELRSVVSKFKI